MSIQIISWNINGIRAIEKKGFVEWVKKATPDVLCLQEIKAIEEQIPEKIQNIEGYHKFYLPAERKGYSGVAVFSREEPKNIGTKLNIEKFDREGRMLMLEYENWILFNVYFPNGKASEERLSYKMEFYKSFQEFLSPLQKEGKKLVICGDVNTAHKEIDLARPKANSKISGFLPQERAWIDGFLEAGFVDTFRVFNDEGGNYSWWDYKTRARSRNVGWRIDYFFISENLKPCLKSAFIMSEVMGSDHCPISVELEF